MPRNYSYNLIEYKEKQRISHLGYKNGMYGKSRDKKLLEKIKNCDRNRLYGFRILFNNIDFIKNEKILSTTQINSKIKKAIHFLYPEKRQTLFKIKKPGSGLHHAHKIESKKQMSDKHRANWLHIDFAKRRISENLNTARPTSFEQKISNLCINNNLPFIYTGNGSFLIGYKNPDFVNIQNKIVIEVYYDYFKIQGFGSCEEYEKQRSEHFAKYGWKTIFIRTNEILNKNWDTLCMNKINKYIN